MISSSRSSEQAASSPSSHSCWPTSSLSRGKKSGSVVPIASSARREAGYQLDRVQHGLEPVFASI